MPDEIKKRLRTIDLSAAAVLLLVVVLAILLGVVPLHHQSIVNAARADELQKQLTDFDGLDHSIARASRDLKETQKRLDDAEGRLPSEGEMAQFMQELARVADDAGLQVDSITPRTVLPVGGYKAMPVEIVGSGDFKTCYKFLQGLRHMNRLTRLDDLVLQSMPPTKQTEGAVPDVCTIRVMISTFMAR